MRILWILMAVALAPPAQSQLPFVYTFGGTGRRVALVDARVAVAPPAVTIRLLDAPYNTSEAYTIYRRPYNGTGADWTLVGTAAPTATAWTDTGVAVGDVWEYQVRRATGAGDAIGYVAVGVDLDQTLPRGRMILLVDETVAGPLAPEIARLRRDLVADGWTVDVRTGPRGTGWATDARVLQTKAIVQAAYDAAPAGDRPTHLFLLGHLPVARAGQGAVAPDEHDENKGARGADTYYADLDGLWTDTATYDVPGIDPLAVNLPGDLKWDQDVIPSELELAFGRVDFADLTSAGADEITLLRRYLDRLHAYRTVAPGWDMGRRAAFHVGYDNSNDGSYRSLPTLATADSVVSYSGGLPYPEWVRQNGPFQVFMQNIEVPDIGLWQSVGMDATVFSSDQSYWGYWDRDEAGPYGLIRSLLAQDTRVLAMLYTTAATNLFHQVGVGETVGWSIKRIMDHNADNQLYEKPEQPWDNPPFWNRTLFQFHGDPTLRLHQVAPASSATASRAGGAVALDWTASPDPAVLGYHVYRAAAEDGPYERITGASVAGEAFADAAPPSSPTWYMVRAVRRETTGSGTFLNPSLGVTASVGAATGAEGAPARVAARVYPNPAADRLTVAVAVPARVTLTDVVGRVVLRAHVAAGAAALDISALAPGVYALRVEAGGDASIERIVVAR